MCSSRRMHKVTVEFVGNMRRAGGDRNIPEGTQAKLRSLELAW